MNKPLLNIRALPHSILQKSSETSNVSQLPHSLLPNPSLPTTLNPSQPNPSQPNPSQPIPPQLHTTNPSAPFVANPSASFKPNTSAPITPQWRDPIEFKQFTELMKYREELNRKFIFEQLRGMVIHNIPANYHESDDFKNMMWSLVK